MDTFSDLRPEDVLRNYTPDSALRTRVQSALSASEIGRSWPLHDLNYAIARDALYLRWPVEDIAPAWALLIQDMVAASLFADPWSDIRHAVVSERLECDPAAKAYVRNLLAEFNRSPGYCDTEEAVRAAWRQMGRDLTRRELKAAECLRAAKSSRIRRQVTWRNPQGHNLY